MRKHYCKNCGTETITIEYYLSGFMCPHCNDGVMIKFPDYETVAQWEKRTGREYPDTAPVYFLDGWFENETWHCGVYAYARDEVGSNKDYTIVATEAGVPPDDWE